MVSMKAFRVFCKGSTFMDELQLVKVVFQFLGFMFVHNISPIHERNSLRPHQIIGDNEMRKSITIEELDNGYLLANDSYGMRAVNKYAGCLDDVLKILQRYFDDE